MTANNLAFVIVTLTAPADVAGVSVGPERPTECRETMERIISDLADEGIDSYGRCFYTGAVSRSLRPVARRE